MHSGSSVVQHPFAVNGGNMLAIELVVVVVAVLPRGSEIVFDCLGDYTFCRGQLLSRSGYASRTWHRSVMTR